MRIDTKNKLFKRIKIFFFRIIVSFLKLLKNDSEALLKLFWLKRTQNFGDSLNPILLSKLTGKKIKWVKSYSPETHYLVMGSILDAATKDTIVWGPGFISQESQCFEKPKKVCAVRGPKSREKLLKDGIDCPEVYGDPALLLPRIYSPSVKKTHTLGIIPHFVDKHHPWFENIKQDDIKIIDIQNPNIFEVVDEILSCEKIASSSLHGIIVADAYHLPSLWVEFSDKVTGNGFKFLDYFLSVKRQETEPLIINENVTIDELMKQFHNYEIDIDLDKLLNAAPFEIKKEYIKTI